MTGERGRYVYGKINEYVVETVATAVETVESMFGKWPIKSLGAA